MTDEKGSESTQTEELPGSNRQADKQLEMKGGGEPERKALTNLGDELRQLRGLLEDERRKGEEMQRRLKYLQADFENYRKRTDKEIQETEDFSRRSLAARLLTLLDDLEMAIASGEKQGEKGPFADGVRMIHKNLSIILEGEGLNRIEAIGKPFNPRYHEAVEKVYGKRKGDDIVIEEIRKGYVFKGQVLRPSLVKVEVAREREEKERKEGST